MIDPQDYALLAAGVAVTLQIAKSVPVTTWLYSHVPSGYRWIGPLFVGAGAAFADAHMSGLAWNEALVRAALGGLAIGLGASGIDAWLSESPLPWSGGKARRKWPR